MVVYVVLDDRHNEVIGVYHKESKANRICKDNGYVYREAEFDTKSKVFSSLIERIAELEESKATFLDALEEISEVTVILGNAQEAYEIVQTIVSHVINGTER